MDIDDTDYEKKQEYTLHHRALIIDEVIKEAGIEGVSQLSRLSKFSGSVAEALVKRDKDRYANDVYNEFAKGSLPELFVRSYFLHLYFLIGSEAYLNICDALHTVSKDHIVMVLYVPEYRRKLADMAESIGGEVLVEYWKKITVKEVKSSPELMIELVELQYLPDEEFRNEDDSNDNNQSIQLKIMKKKKECNLLSYTPFIWI